jgi:raffinose/stachyose/melibiose transport system substrate-binding protein
MKKAKMLLYVLVLASILLAGCGAPAAPAAPAATAPAAAAQQPAASNEKVNLVFWSFWNETESSALVVKDYITEYQKLHPNITISVVWNGRENQTKLRTALSSGTKVDFMDQDADQVAGGMEAEGLGYQLDDLLNEPAADGSGPFKDTIAPGILDQHKMNGHYYLLSYLDNPVMFWYNKDLFDKAGVKPPTTWDEFLTVSQKLKDAGITPLAVEGDGDDYNMMYFTYMVERVKGVGFLLKTMEDKTGEMWKDAVYVDTLTKLRDLWDKGYIPTESKGYIWPAGQQTLATGESAMELCGGWIPKELTDSGTTDPNFRWGGFRFPAISGGAGSIDDLHAWNIAYMILKDSAHPKEAFDFIKFTMSKENAKTMADKSSTGVTTKGVTWAPAIADGETAATNAKSTFMHVDGGTALHPEFTKNVIYVNFKKAFFGDITPADFATTMAADAKAYWETHQK